MLGVHVRRGDKTAGSAINGVEMADMTNDAVLSAVERVAVACGFRRVFVASRDTDLLAALPAWSERGGNVTFVANPGIAALAGSDYSTADLVSASLDGSAELLSAVTDITLLASADGFLGRLASNLSRVVAELAAAQHVPTLFPSLSMGDDDWWWRAFP